MYTSCNTHGTLLHHWNAVLAFSIMPERKLCTLSGACSQSTLTFDFEVLQMLNTSELVRAA